MTLTGELGLSILINVILASIYIGILWARTSISDKRLDNIEKKLGISSNGDNNTVVTKNECFLMESLVRERLTNIERRLTDIEEALRGR